MSTFSFVVSLLLLLIDGVGGSYGFFFGVLHGML
jgi:hypothetical protein